MENRREWEWIEYSFAAMALVMMMMTVSVHAAHDHNTWHLPAKNASAGYSHETVAVDLTLVESAVAKGAVCLDGSPPGYHFHRGFGSGVNNWLIHIEGGGWCNNLTVCSLRKHTRLGSSNYMAQKVAFSGILSPNQKQNPDFYNWNRIKVQYCDGASFTGDVEAVHPIYKLYFRGQRIWRAIIDDLLAKGMYKVEQALLSGCSAGGLTSILHCDNFRELLPKSAKVKCLADAGFFINVKDVSGADHIKSFYNDVVTLQQSVKNLPLACTSKIVPSQCFFPQYLLPYIQTPLFILNAAYDSWQIKNIVAPGVADPHGHWHYCKLNIKSCTPNQLQIMQGFRLEMLSALKVFENSITGGMFINGCYAHCQSEMQETWLEADSPRLNKKAIAQAVGDWYFDRGSMKAIDCPYPCDPTCHNRIFTPDELLEN